MFNTRTVNVDAFLVHENDKTKTDVLLHFVDYRDNSGNFNYLITFMSLKKQFDLHLNKYFNFFIVLVVILVREALDVLKIIDLHMEELDPFFREFNVLHTEGADKGISSFPAFLGASFNKNSGDSMVIILWLGGLCIFLFALLVLVLSLVRYLKVLFKCNLFRLIAY